jgi:hypothetical protein
MFHDREKFLWFLQMEPNRLVYYWFSRTMTQTDLCIRSNANLATAILRLCNIGRIVLARLLRPDIHQRIFGQPITQEASDTMLRAKNTYIQLWSEVMKHGIQYGSMPVAPPTYQRPSNIDLIPYPIDDLYGAGQPTNHTTVTGIYGNEAPEDIEQERHDSGVAVEGKDQDHISHAVDNDAKMESGGSTSDEHLQWDTTEMVEESNISYTASADIPITSDNSDNGEDCDTADHDQTSAFENGPETNEYLHESDNFLDNAPSEHSHDSVEKGQVFGNGSSTDGQYQQHDEINGDSEEVQGTSCLAVGQYLQQDESKEVEVQDTSNPRIEAASLSERLINDLGTLPDSGFEIAQQHPETVLVLQLIMGLGRVIQARNVQQGEGDRS